MNVRSGAWMVLADVARGLQVTLGDLLGEPVLMEDEDKNDDVPSIRDALMAPRRLSRTLFSSAMSPEYIEPAPVAQLWKVLGPATKGRPWPCRRGSSWSDQDRSGMESTSADDAVYRRACACGVGTRPPPGRDHAEQDREADLAWIAAERAMQADDPLVLVPLPVPALTRCWLSAGSMTRYKPVRPRTGDKPGR
ncbi:hypothetical protein [Amycolatopsis japonica]